MTSDARRHPHRLQHVTATGTALAAALGPVVLGALLVRSAGGDPMASVNALIAGGGQRARVSGAQLRSCGGRVQSHGLRAGRKAWGVLSSASGPRTGRAVATGPAAARNSAKQAASSPSGMCTVAAPPNGPQGSPA
ncbi:hypothetical protein R1T08_04545 [Streptomyces sp. SBC-4]|nr:hypothetical protein [Streptomyces sp. SBC-4]MDV5143575.1 hypothetical protein [Streptomyces sp. SBC-4]